MAGTVSIRVFGAASEAVRSKLGGLGVAGRITVSNDAGAVTARVFPRDRGVNGELARMIAEVATREGWKFDDLRTEEGRLDDVFRGITRPDTTQNAG